MNEKPAQAAGVQLRRIVLPFLLPALLWTAFLGLTFSFPRVITTLTKDENGNVDAKYESKALFRFTVSSGASSSVSGVEYDPQTWMGKFSADPPFEVELEESGQSRLIQRWLDGSDEDSGGTEFRVVSHRLFVVEVLVFGLAMILTCFAMTNAATVVQARGIPPSELAGLRNAMAPASSDEWNELFADEYFTHVVAEEELVWVRRKLPIAVLISIVLLFAIACGLYGDFFISVLLIPSLIIGLMIAGRLIHRTGYMSEFRLEVPNRQLRWKRMLAWRTLSFDEIKEFYCDSVESKGEPGFAASIGVRTNTGRKHSLYETLSAKKDMKSAKRHFEWLARELNSILKE